MSAAASTIPSAHIYAGVLASSSMRVHVMRLPPGSDVLPSLEQLVRLAGARSACILSAVGSLTHASLRFANVTDAATRANPLPVGHYEIVSLSGLLSSDGGSHAHASISDSTGRTLGGHVMPTGNLVYTTLEVVVGVMPDVEFAREKCHASGWDELVVYPTGTSKQPGTSTLSKAEEKAAAEQQ